MWPNDPTRHEHTSSIQPCSSSKLVPSLHSLQHCLTLQHSPSKAITVQPTRRALWLLRGYNSTRYTAVYRAQQSTACSTRHTDRQTDRHRHRPQLEHGSQLLGVPEQAGSLDPVKGMLIIFFTPLARTVSVVVCSLPWRRPVPQAAVNKLRCRHKAEPAANNRHPRP